MVIWAASPLLAGEGQNKNFALPQPFKITPHASRVTYAASQHAANSYGMQTKWPVGGMANVFGFIWTPRTPGTPRSLEVQRLLKSGRRRGFGPHAGQTVQNKFRRTGGGGRRRLPSEGDLNASRQAFDPSSHAIMSESTLSHSALTTLRKRARDWPVGRGLRGFACTAKQDSSSAAELHPPEMWRAVKVHWLPISNSSMPGSHPRRDWRLPLPRRCPSRPGPTYP